MRFNKRGQESGVGMSFGFIFAIILIIAFVLAAIWGIKYFLDLNNCSRIGLSVDDLQKEVQRAYQSSTYSKEISLDLPGIEKICFANLSSPITGDLDVYGEIRNYDFTDANTFLYPPQKSCGMPYKNIKYLNITTIIKDKNPYCIEVGEKLKITFDPYTLGRGVVIK